MKQMPYKIEERAIEQAKYRAKMAVREVAYAHTETPSRAKAWRWSISMIGGAVAVAIVSLGIFFYHDTMQKDIDLNDFIAEMRYMPIDVVRDMTVDMIYYAEDESSL